jgi:hypothetical protein
VGVRSADRRSGPGDGSVPLLGRRSFLRWSSAAVVTAVSILAYALVGIVESVVLARMGLD